MTPSLPLRLFAFLAIALAAAFPARAQIALNITDPKAAPVTVQSADISTEITGRLAVTTFDLVFANPNNRDLEGTFEFPLLDGQRVVRFALDINGLLREAVPVEKEKGRVVFEEIQRRRVDPGLLEQTAGNNYRARIFPIPANGTRRIVIAYQEDLLAGAAANSAPRYRLALDFPGALKTFALSASVFSAPGARPAKAATTLALELPAWRDGRVISVKKENFTARGVLELELPSRFDNANDRPAVITETFNGREYFYAEAALPAAAMKAKPRPAPKTVGILWDASGSGRARDHAREFALLDVWFATVRDVDVKLICLRDTATAPASFKVRKGKWTDLRAALEKTIYDGATSLDGLADDATVDEWLLFSDGLVNFGAAQNIEKLPFRAPVHTVSASASAAPSFLRGLSSRGNGEFADLLALDAKTAAARLRQISPRIIAVERDPEAVAQIFPETGAPVNADTGALIVTGILRKPAATVRVKVGFSDADAQMLEVAVKSGEGAGTLAARAWAVAKIEHLTTAPGDNREDIRRTSREFRIVTADTSLIVLETLDDYIRYDIEPPKEDAKLREKWNRRMQEKKSKTEGTVEERKEYREELVEAFNEQMEWWEEEFPKDAKPLATKEKPKQDLPETPVRPVPDQANAAQENAAATGEDIMDPVTGRMRPPPLTTILSEERFGAASITTSNSDDVIFLDKFSIAGSRMRSNQSPEITLKPWSPEADYLDRLRRAPVAERYTGYIEERSEHIEEPGFYMDVADFFFNEAGDETTALRILSNLAELGLEDAALLRVLGYRLVQAKKPGLALPVFERVLEIRGEEPQSRRDLALVCAKLGQYQRAVDLLWEIAERPWDDRFEDIGLIVLNEMNAIIATCGQKLDISKIDARLLKNMPVGLCVILTWDANSCDIDLWVDDPNGERAMYNNSLTYQGGRMSEDYTEGYGPEVFLLRYPKPGKYTVHIEYFGENAASALGPVTAQVRLVTGFGTPQEKEKLITVRLVDKKESLEIGSIEIGE